jgi:hypothetical protein
MPSAAARHPVLVGEARHPVPIGAARATEAISIGFLHD